MNSWYKSIIYIALALVMSVSLNVFADGPLDDVPAYYDGNGTVTVYVAGGMHTAWLDSSEWPENLTVKGQINDDDLSYLRSMSSLWHLDMSEAEIVNGHLPDAAFANMEIISVETPTQITSVGSSLFTGCNHLAAVVWNADIAATETALNGIANPNLLLYVNRSDYAPQSISNVVANGVAKSIVLSDVKAGGNFYCPQSFVAERISYMHNFTLKSGRNETAEGWESLALPFDVQRIEHEKNGVLTPFKTYNVLIDQGQDVDGLKPFWLYAMSTEGAMFEACDAIAANTPYIICMPNNEDYASTYNQQGNVTFSSQNINVAKTEAKVSKRGSIAFVPCFEYMERSSKISLLNDEATDDYRPGSVFLPNQRDAHPFEAYITNYARPNYVLRLGENVEVSVRNILMHRDAKCTTDEAYNLNGQRIKTICKGIYIVRSANGRMDGKNGKKIVVK